jgi:Flp pilus assembly pilin Flp
MVRMQTGWWRLKEERGQTTSEYLVIAGVVVAIILAVAATFKDQIGTALDTLLGKVQEGAQGGGAAS